MVNPVGILMVLLGLASAVFPYRLSRFQEQMDAIGSTRRFSEVEPAEWRVTLTRIGGVAFVIIGLVMTFA